MKNNSLLFNAIMLSVLILPLMLLTSSSAGAQEEAELVPVELNDTEWEVEMVYVTEKGKKDTSSDKLKFKDKKFIAESFQNKGYDPSNYSLTAQADGTTRFGTMQIKGKETSFWKGVVTEDTIDGSVHTQYGKEGSNKTVYFKGELTSGVLAPKSEKKPEPTPPPAPPVQEVKETQPQAPAQPVTKAVEPAAVKKETPDSAAAPIKEDLPSTP